MFVLCHAFAKCGPNSTVAQMNTSFNYARGTLRGVHRQSCTLGAIADVEVRPKSQTVCRTRLPDAANKTEVSSRVSGRCKAAWVIYRIAGTNPVWVLGAEPRR
jgi:hypothetical protein